MMKTFATLLAICLLFKLLPAQEIIFSPNADSFQLCVFAKTENRDFIDMVDAQLSGYSGAPGFPFPDPFYLGQCQPIYSQYVNGSITLNPKKDVNHLNGVSTYDMVLIAHHILGIQPLSSPYKIIAADANNSQSITVLDLVEIRKLILGLNTDFPNNTSWCFIDSTFVFPNPMNPWVTPLPEICVITSFDEDVTKNYVGIKIGDVNGSAIPNDSLFVIDDRTLNQKLKFYLENQTFKSGESVNLVFKAKEFKDISGFQFELNFDSEFLEFKGFEKGALEQFDESNLGLNNIQDGEMALSWVKLNYDYVDKPDENFFQLIFNTLKNGNLNEVFRITENRLKAEAYDDQLNIKKLTLEFTDNKNISNTELFQNQPNPFHDGTNIGFYINEPQAIKLQVFDVRGNLVRVYKNTFEAGYNQFFISPKDIISTGVYYYQLVTENGTFTKKMIKI